MNDFDVIVLNSHGIGQYAYCDHMPTWGETLCVSNWHIAEDGGKGSNVAVALGRLNVKTAYIGKVGNDPWGDLGEKWMKDANVDVTYLFRTDEVSTGTGLILISPEGQNCIIDGDSSNSVLKIEEVKDALLNMKGSKLLTSGFEIPYKISLESLKYAKSLNMKTALNPSPLPNNELGKLDYIDYLFVNEIETKALLSLQESALLENNEALVRALKSKYLCKNIIMTCGEKGCSILEKDNFFSVNAIPVKNVVNTAGAGDGFLAAVLAKLNEGLSLKEAAQWASYYSALAISIDGTIPAYRPIDEVEAFIQKTKEY